MELRLVDQGQFTVVDGQAKLLQQLRFGLDTGGNGTLLGPTEPSHRGAGPFGGVHRQVRFLEQFVGAAFGLARRDGYPDAGTYRKCLAVEFDRRVECLHQPAGDAFRPYRVSIDDDREFITAQSRNGVARPHCVRDASACPFEQLVAGRVAESVIDQLEIVEIQDQHGYRAAVAGAGPESVVEPVGEQRPVPEPGERIQQSLFGHGSQ